MTLSLLEQEILESFRSFFPILEADDEVKEPALALADIERILKYAARRSTAGSSDTDLSSEELTDDEKTSIAKVVRTRVSKARHSDFAKKVRAGDPESFSAMQQRMLELLGSIKEQVIADSTVYDNAVAIQRIANNNTDLFVVAYSLILLISTAIKQYEFPKAAYLSTVAKQALRDEANKVSESIVVEADDDNRVVDPAALLAAYKKEHAGRRDLKTISAFLKKQGLRDNEVSLLAREFLDDLVPEVDKEIESIVTQWVSFIRTSGDKSATGLQTFLVQQGFDEQLVQSAINRKFSNAVSSDDVVSAVNPAALPGNRKKVYDRLAIFIATLKDSERKAVYKDLSKLQRSMQDDSN